MATALAHETEKRMALTQKLEKYQKSEAAQETAAIVANGVASTLDCFSALARVTKTRSLSSRLASRRSVTTCLTRPRLALGFSIAVAHPAIVDVQLATMTAVAHHLAALTVAGTAAAQSTCLLYTSPSPRD